MLPRSAIHIARINWSHRGLVVDLVHREFRLRYVGSLLGSWWNLIHPIVMIAIYSIIFSSLMRSRMSGLQIDHPLGYTFFLCSALLPWNSFVETINRGSGAFVDNSHLVKKVSFPLEVFVPVVAGASSLNFVISYGCFLALAVMSGFGLGWSVLLVPLVFVIQLIFSAGICLGLSTLTVFFRDIQQFTSISLNIWFWLTPIVYMREVLPERIGKLVDLNPFAHFAGIYQKLAFEQRFPAMEEWGIISAFALVSIVAGASIFTRFKPDIPDEL
jgi:lipopolysaccharide transport system permease protein